MILKNKPCPKCESASKIIQEWVDKQGHDRCWYYPDLFKKLVQILGIKISTNLELPPRKEFEAGCKKYQDEEYGDH